MGSTQESVSGSCLCLYNHRQVRQGWWVAQGSQGDLHGGRWAESPCRGGAVEGPAARAGGTSSWDSACPAAAPHTTV